METKTEIKGDYICNFCDTKTVESLFFWEDGYDRWNYEAVLMYKCNKCKREKYLYDEDYYVEKVAEGGIVYFDLEDNSND